VKERRGQVAAATRRGEMPVLLMGRMPMPRENMPEDPMETPQVLKLADGFFLRQAVDNIAWADLGGHAVVIDALEQAELKDEVFAALRSTLGAEPVRYVLNTHTHYDHVALNGAFVAEFGSEVLNFHTARLKPDGRWLEGPRRGMRILPMPGCHTEEDCVAWFPSDKVLFVGDIFGWGLIPLTRDLRDESALHLLETYRRLIDFGAAVVVPGHGPAATTKDLQRWVDYFQWLRREVQAAVSAGRTEEQIQADLPAPQDMRSWWRFLQWKHEDSLQKVLRAVRRGRLT
jgi:glyoxylase-like metal-dependent hydrolase (beta-lactamase superfamily II)